MNINNFHEGLSILSYTGYTLTHEQTALIENSLIILQNENKFRDIFFWGRINGIENDYYIAFGYLKDCLRGRRYFYSTNCFDWYLMPPHNPDMYETCLLSTSKFQGDPTLVLDVLMDPIFISNDSEPIGAATPEVRKLKEEDRLSCIVNLITDESAILPRGAIYKRVDRKTIYSPLFHGLSRLDAEDINNYQLYRAPRHTWNYNLLKRQDYNFPTDFLDTLDAIIPSAETSFSLTMEKDPGIVIIKSLHWPGMMFYHKTGTSKHGFCYLGDGRKNFDLLFMI